MMRMGVIGLIAVLALGQAQTTGDGGLIDSMDTLSFKSLSDKSKVEVVPGRLENAQQFTFEENGQGKYIVGRAGGRPDWDHAAGLSFWVKGDGSDHLGGIEFIWNGDYGTRYAAAFPIDSREWRKVVLPWRDLVPELSKTTEILDPAKGLAPSKLGPLQFGKWWYWRDYAAHSYAIDDVRLEPAIRVAQNDFLPAGAPLARVLARLKQGKPITVVTMGDSLTDVNHWTNREHNWPLFFKAHTGQKFGSEVTIVNPAMGGTELRHNVIVMPRWSLKTAAPDLVTIFFGFNDWSSGMRGPGFAAAQKDAIDRVRRATGGHADVLILSTCPSLENPAMLAEMAAACRTSAQDRKAGMADVFAAFSGIPEAGRAALYASDKVHLSLAGQELVAKTVLAALEHAGTDAGAISRP